MTKQSRICLHINIRVQSVTLLDVYVAWAATQLIIIHHQTSKENQRQEERDIKTLTQLDKADSRTPQCARSCRDGSMLQASRTLHQAQQCCERICCRVVCHKVITSHRVRAFLNPVCQAHLVCLACPVGRDNFKDLKWWKKLRFGGGFGRAKIGRFADFRTELAKILDAGQTTVENDQKFGGRSPTLAVFLAGDAQLWRSVRESNYRTRKRPTTAKSTNQTA